MDKEKIKRIFNIENLLYLFLIICPILDAASFMFRNTFKTSFSISTFVRPIIPIIAIIYIFFKGNKKKNMIIAGLIYTVYALIHLFLFKRIVTTCAYGNVIRELQYIVNYTFMIMNLFIYMYIFILNKNKEQRKEAVNKLKKVILISFTIYIALMFIAILTGTSSHTYMEDNMGFKGWFESGNSIGAIMILSLFIVIPNIFNKNENIKIRIWTLIDVLLAGVYLTTLLGTRVGLFGFALVIFLYIVSIIVLNIIKNRENRQGKKINKKVLIIGTAAFIIIAIVVAIFGSTTIARRKLLKSRESGIYDSAIGENAHVTGDMLGLVNKIQQNELPEEYMSKPMQNSLIDLYNFANKHNISNTDMRTIQFVYHTELIKNQHNPLLILFGNGYMTHFYEFIFEMEVPAFLYNFGIIGFILYFIPFLVIAIKGIKHIFKNSKKNTIEDVMQTIALCFAILISFFSGYTFFNSSTTMIIITLCVFVINNIEQVKGETNG